MTPLWCIEVAFYDGSLYTGPLYLEAITAEEAVEKVHRHYGNDKHGQHAAFILSVVRTKGSLLR